MRFSRIIPSEYGGIHSDDNAGFCVLLQAEKTVVKLKYKYQEQ